MQTYTAELRAELTAKALLGEPIKRLAREYKMPEATIRHWRDMAKAQPVLKPEKQEDLGTLIYELLAELARGSAAIAKQLQDPRYLERQSADHLAISLGVSIDKLAGLAGALERGRREREAFALPPGHIEGETQPG